ncbi:MAG: DUF1858 domain-containing protein [Candidatus Zixiibacteriota bacterium]
MNTNRPEITPDLKLAALLDAYPELEQTLVDLAPGFARLQDPSLRRTVAQVTTLRQAAQVGGIGVGDLINQLRSAAGVQLTVIAENKGSIEKPDWVVSGSVVESLDARPLIETGQHPVGMVMSTLGRLKRGELFELITPFVPAPLIGMAETQGFETWTTSESGDLFKTFFRPRS